MNHPRRSPSNLAGGRTPFGVRRPTNDEAGTDALTSTQPIDRRTRGSRSYRWPTVRQLVVAVLSGLLLSGGLLYLYAAVKVTRTVAERPQDWIEAAPPVAREPTAVNEGASPPVADNHEVTVANRDDSPDIPDVGVSPDAPTAALPGVEAPHDLAAESPAPDEAGTPAGSALEAESAKAIRGLDRAIILAKPQSRRAPIQPLPAPLPSAKMADADGFAMVDAAMSALRHASIAFNTPEQINLADAPTIELLLSIEQSAAVLQNLLSGPGSRQAAVIRVAPRTRASLVGDDFHITAITSEEQAVGATGVVKWAWKIRPTLAGRHDLHLTLSAIVDVDGESTPRLIRTFERTIEVNVTVGQQMNALMHDNWQWLLATIVVPLAGWAWKRRETPAAGA